MDATQWGYWLAGDKKRFSRTHFIGIHVESSVKPSFTTQSTDEVYKILRKIVREYRENGNIDVNNKEKPENESQVELEESPLREKK